ncbi:MULTISPECIES: hypothetical protein [Anaerofustis]|uniref:hypothetical protein n=1 Tax=Anaerofustis TaxID=264995 RepID=UPI001105C077|nr:MULTISPECIES: hypothetical protein [Anaerofustis]MCO8193187.1 hypothetical protein [Anaerofustis sp. NSJ-163]
MVRIIGGAEGTGKTQKLIELANSENKEAKGLQVYIDSSLNHSREVMTQIRFINTSEFHVASPEMFFGFLCGLIAGNYDINQIYIDDILEILNAKHLETAIAFLDQLEALTKEYECDITLTLGARDEDELNLLKKYEYQEA